MLLVTVTPSMPKFVLQFNSLPFPLCPLPSCCPALRPLQLEERRKLHAALLQSLDNPSATVKAFNESDREGAAPWPAAAGPGAPPGCPCSRPGSAGAGLSPSPAPPPLRPPDPLPPAQAEPQAAPGAPGSGSTPGMMASSAWRHLGRAWRAR